MERYKAYKDSGVEWIGEIPVEWEYGRLKQRNAIAGRIGWQGLTSDEYCDEGPYLITGVNFANGVIDWDSCVHITDERWEEATQIQIEEGDLLITKDGTVGKVAIAEGLNQRASLNSGVMVVRPTSNKQCIRYLFWLLQSEVFWGWFTNINSGNSTIIHLYQGDFLNFDYYLPSISEQRTIADYLDAKTAEIDALVADCEREVGLLREYRKAVISETVTKGLDPDATMRDSGVEWIGEIPDGWITGRIRDAAKRINVGVVIRPSDYYDDSGSVPFLRGVNVKEFRFDLDDLMMISEKSNQLLSKSIVREGDIVVVRDGTIGVAAVIPSELDGSNCVSLLEITPKERFHERYLCYCINSPICSEQISYMSNGTALQHINAGELSDVAIPMPTYSEQAAIAAYLDAKTAEIDSLIEAKQSMADKLREYRRSLISEAVTGKFKVPGA